MSMMIMCGDYDDVKHDDESNGKMMTIMMAMTILNMSHYNE